jgi:dTDP-4-amino-4,6-dideoxygalactose transaminase
MMDPVIARGYHTPTFCGGMVVGSFDTWFEGYRVSPTGGEIFHIIAKGKNDDAIVESLISQIQGALGFHRKAHAHIWLARYQTWLDPFRKELQKRCKTQILGFVNPNTTHVCDLFILERV